MDKDRRAESHGQSSWLDMQQFIGDLLTSGSSSVQPPSARELQHHHPPDGPFHLAWGAPGGPGVDGLGALKGAGLAPMTQPRALPQTHDKSGPAALGRQTQSGAVDRSGQTRDRRGGGGDGEHHGCTCPGCPFSSSAPVLETLRPRQPPLPAQDPSEPCSSSTSSSSHPETPRPPGGQTQGKDPHSPGQASGPTSGEGSGSPAHLPQPPHHHHHHHLPMLPCLCSLQSCAQLLGQMEGADSSHGRRHFHPCAFAACLPCPAQLSAHGRARAPPQPAFPCYAFAACPHLCQRQQHHHHHAGEQRAQVGVAGGGAAAGRSASTSLPHPCMHCPASFARPSQLLQHQRSEHANKQGGFICTECGRSFNSHSNLRIHLNVHTGARPYACADCGKSFSQSGALKIHRRTHTGERPYACNYCGRGFPHLAGVRAHQRTHTGEKPYHCNQCGKCFTQSGALKIHVRIHTGERPFVCSLCGKAFSNRSGIRFHYRAVHAMLPEPASTGPGTPGRPRGAGTATSSSAPGPGSGSGADDRKPRAVVRGVAAGVAARPGLPYACEDCGLCFKDAPSRNAHQALTHYSDGGGGGGDATGCTEAR